MEPGSDFLSAVFREVVLQAHPAALVRDHADEVARFCGDRPSLLLAVGKAAAAMAGALPRGVPESFATLLGEPDAPAGLQAVRSDHPLPSQRSVEAAEKALAAVAQVPAETPVVIALSGGTSAAWCVPTSDLTLEDLIETNRVVMACGASIQQLNCVRRHISAIKGGRLALAAAPRPVLTLALVDVVGGQPQDVGSGPGVGDPTTFADALQVVRSLDATGQLPSRVVTHLQRGAAGGVEENPAPDDGRLGRCRYLPIGSPDLLLQLAEQVTRTHGLEPSVERRPVTDPVDGLAARLARWIEQAEPGTLWVLAGEPTLSLPPNPGCGGRAQHLALSVLRRLRNHDRKWALLAAGSDGRDGTSDAAGAVVDHRIAGRVDPDEIDDALARADSATLLARLDAQVTTGATGNNLTDLILAWSGPGS